MERMNSGNEVIGMASSNRNNRIKLIIPIVVAIIIVIAFVVINSKPNRNERIAIEAVQNIQDTLKSPDSMKLQRDVLITEFDDKEYTLVEYSAQNSFGVQLRETAFFCNGKYIGTNNDKVGVGDSELLDAQMLYSMLSEFGEDAAIFEDGKFIDKDFVEQKAGLN